MPTELWFASVNPTIAAIRATGATNLILVPGNAWTGYLRSSIGFLTLKRSQLVRKLVRNPK